MALREEDMSAHLLFCFEPHRRVVLDFLHNVNPVFDEKTLRSVSDWSALCGLEHITFFDVPNNPLLPWLLDDFWVVLRDQGALVIEIDDSMKRSKAPRVLVRRAAHD